MLQQAAAAAATETHLRGAARGVSAWDEPQVSGGDLESAAGDGHRHNQLRLRLQNLRYE